MKCDKCNKKAKYNLQNSWHLYRITGKTDEEEFEEIDTYDGSGSEYYCEKCAKEEKII